MPANRKKLMNRSKRRTGRRHPLATVALLALGLVFTGGAYAALSSGTAQAEADRDQCDRGERMPPTGLAAALRCGFLVLSHGDGVRS